MFIRRCGRGEEGAEKGKKRQVRFSLEKRLYPIQPKVNKKLKKGWTTVSDIRCHRRAALIGIKKKH